MDGNENYSYYHPLPSYKGTSASAHPRHLYS